MPKETGSPFRDLIRMHKRQGDSSEDDPEPYSDTDYLRDGKSSSILLYMLHLLMKLSAIPYRSNYLSDNGALTSMKVGAKPSDATMTVFTTIKNGNALPSPSDTNQGSGFQIDHLLEMQNIHGAFNILSKP